MEELNKTSVSLGQDLCTYLTEEQNIEEVRFRRKIIHYYDKIVKGSSPLTMRNIKDIEMDKARNLPSKCQEEDRLYLALNRVKGFFENEEEEMELDEEEEEIKSVLVKYFFELPDQIKEEMQEDNSQKPVPFILTYKRLGRSVAHRTCCWLAEGTSCMTR